MSDQGPLFPTVKAVPNAGRRLGRGLRRASRWVLLLLLVLVAVHLAATLITGRMVKRELARLRAQGQPLTLAEMAPKVPEGEKNAAFFYEQAFNALRLSEEERVQEVEDPDKLSEHPSLAREVVAANGDYFRLLDRASRVEHCAFNVDWANPADAVLSHYATMRQAPRFLVVRSKLHLLDGQVDAAAQDCTTLFRIAEHAGVDPILIGTMVSVSTYRTGLEQLETVLSSGDPSPAITREILAQLGTANQERRLDRALRGERAFGITMLDRLRHNPREMDLLADPELHPVRARLYRLYPTLGRPLLNLDSLSHLQFWQRSLTTADTAYSERVARAGKARGSVERLPKYRSLLSRELMPVYAGAFDIAYSSAAEINAARVALLLTLYRQEHGRYPASLSALPQPLPLDPFVQKPYHYRTEGKGFVVWSVGADLQDNHGTDVPLRERWASYHPEGKHHDLVFRVAR